MSFSCGHTISSGLHCSECSPSVTSKTPVTDAFDQYMNVLDAEITSLRTRLALAVDVLRMTDISGVIQHANCNSSGSGTMCPACRVRDALTKIKESV